MGVISVQVHGQTYLNSERGAGAHDDARDEREDAGEAAVSHGEEGVKKGERVT